MTAERRPKHGHGKIKLIRTITTTRKRRRGPTTPKPATPPLPPLSLTPLVPPTPQRERPLASLTPAPRRQGAVPAVRNRQPSLSPLSIEASSESSPTQDVSDEDGVSWGTVFLIAFLVVILIGGLLGLIWWILSSRRADKPPEKTVIAGPTSTDTPLVLSDTTCDALKIQLQTLNNQNIALTLENERLRTQPSPSCPDTPSPTTATTTTTSSTPPPTTVIKNPSTCPIVDSTNTFLQLLNGATYISRVQSYMGQKMNECMVLFLQPVAVAPETSKPVLGLSKTSQDITGHSLMDLCLNNTITPRDEALARSLPGYFDKTKGVMKDIQWFYPNSISICSPSTLAPITPPRLPLTRESQIAPLVFYLPFSITQQDLADYNNSSWFFFFVADAVGALYLDGKLLKTVTRTDIITNVEDAFAVAETYYNGADPNLAKWASPTVGEHILTVVITPFVPAFRYGFALSAFFGSVTDPRPVRAHQSATIVGTSNTVNPILIGTVFENNYDKWWFSTCT